MAEADEYESDPDFGIIRAPAVGVVLESGQICC